MIDIKQRLLDACVGHPNAKIAWPHRLLHDAASEIERLRTELGKEQDARTLAAHERDSYRCEVETLKDVIKVGRGYI